MPSGVNVRYVKFTPEEMAIDAADVDASKPASAGSRNSIIRLDADVAKVFKTADEVNNALRKLIEAVPVDRKKRKTA